WIRRRRVARAGLVVRAARGQVRARAVSLRRGVLQEPRLVAPGARLDLLRGGTSAAGNGEDRDAGAALPDTASENHLRHGLPERIREGAAHPSCPTSSGPGLSSGRGLKMAASSLRSWPESSFHFSSPLCAMEIAPVSSETTSTTASVSSARP